MKLNIEFTIGFSDPSKDYPYIIQRKLHRIKNKLKKYQLTLFKCSCMVYNKHIKRRLKK